MRSATSLDRMLVTTASMNCAIPVVTLSAIAACSRSTSLTAWCWRPTPIGRMTDHLTPSNITSAPTCPSGKVSTIRSRCSAGARRSSPRQYRSRRQNSVLPLPCPTVLSSSSTTSRSAGSGAQMMFRPGRRWISRKMTPGSLQITKRRIQNRGSTRSGSGLSFRPPCPSRSSCRAIDPTPKGIWKRMHNFLVIAPGQDAHDHAHTPIGPPFGKDGIQPGSRSPSSCSRIFDQTTVASKLPHCLAPGVVGLAAAIVSLPPVVAPPRVRPDVANGAASSTDSEGVSNLGSIVRTAARRALRIGIGPPAAFRMAARTAASSPPGSVPGRYHTPSGARRGRPVTVRQVQSYGVHGNSSGRRVVDGGGFR